MRRCRRWPTRLKSWIWATDECAAVSCLGLPLSFYGFSGVPSLPCVYDANVLYPAQLRDLLMHLALAELTRAHWTERIHREWTRNLLANRPDIQPEQLERTKSFMNRALPGATVAEMSYRPYVADLELPDPDDRHVLAAAIAAEAEAIVTFNLTDFPPEALHPHGARVLHPDALVSEIAERDSEATVLEVMRRHRRTQKKPPISPEEYIDVLRRARLEEASRLAERFRDRL